VWNQFLAVYRDTGASDATGCQSFNARIELGKTEGLAADIAKEWLIPHSLPECDRPFAWLKQNGALTNALIEGGSTWRSTTTMQRRTADHRSAAARPRRSALSMGRTPGEPLRNIDALIASRALR